MGQGLKAQGQHLEVEGLHGGEQRPMTGASGRRRGAGREQWQALDSRMPGAERWNTGIWQEKGKSVGSGAL